MRITRVYTRSGDAGETSLATGERIPKDDARVEAYGTVDELNATLALGRAALPELGQRDDEQRLDEILRRVQSELFCVGAELASPDPSTLTIGRVTADHIDALEGEIDAFNADLEPLTEFLLPGGGPASAHLHLSRVTCRRAERRVVALARMVDVEAAVLKYLNRLGDLLFVLARWAARSAGQPEYLWSPTQD
jgi:cob(I)alamin adenosyltransferase